MKEQTETNLAKNTLQDVVSYAKENGFIYPSSEIYEGLQAVYDYGHNGVELKKNLQALWWKSMTQLNMNIVGIDAAIFMHPKTWQASGHVDSFSDPMIDNKDSKKRYRVDVLIEAYASKLKELGKSKEAESLLESMNELLKLSSLDGLHKLILSNKIPCPVSNTLNWTDVRNFNLMFSTQCGAIEESSNTVYLRPETAQGIFVNFANVQKNARMKLPFGIAQIGKAFRNEIIARQFIFRMREFEQMEMQFFVKPGTENHWFEHWKESRLKWHKSLGIPEDCLRIHVHEQLAHYAKNAVDIEYNFPFGFKEIEGIHSRTDFDLKNHQTYSNKKLSYFDADVNQTYIPYVIETSIGCDRTILMLLCNGLTTEKFEDAGETKTRTYLKILPALAPVKVAVFPLMKKDGLQIKALSILDNLKLDFPVAYEENQSIGKRYARQDIIGTPYCITVDYQTLENDTVTIRERNSMTQTRIHCNDLNKFISDKTSLRSVFIT